VKETTIESESNDAKVEKTNDLGQDGREEKNHVNNPQNQKMFRRKSISREEKIGMTPKNKEKREKEKESELDVIKKKLSEIGKI
jgi:hypothetical protein